MGRRLSADTTPRRAGRKGSEGQVNYPNKQAAGDNPFGEYQTSPRPALTPRKRYPSVSEHDTPPEATDSLSSFYLASASSSSSELVQQMSPRDVWSHRSSQIDRLDSTAKSLLSSTGRALMRHASKLSVASSISHDRDEEGKVIWKISGLGAAAEPPHRKSWRSRIVYWAPPSPDTQTGDIRKRAISAPFDFKHVTHTYREQVQGLERASQNELISEFSAIRAGQRADPKLRGIKAESLLTQETPSSTGKAEPTSPPFDLGTKVESRVVPSRSQSQPSSPRSTTTSNIPSPRAVENFSRPVSRVSFSPISPPKRISSLNACSSTVAASEDGHDANDRVRLGRTHSRQTSRAAAKCAPLLVGINAPDQESDFVVGHAISTTDDSARHLKASPLPMLPRGLDVLPEDEEGVVHNETQPSLGGSGDEVMPLRHVQSFPLRRQDANPNGRLPANPSDTLRHSVSLEEGRTQETFDGFSINWPEPPKHTPGRDTKRFSIGLKPMCETQDWEQDVDYCYEHAAEAESDFNWDQHVANSRERLLPFDSHEASEQVLRQLDQLAGLSLHDRKHDSQESSVLSLASSIADVSRSTHSVSSLPDLEYSVNSSRESMDLGTCHGGKRSSKRTRRSHSTSPSKDLKSRPALGLSYSLFPSNSTPHRIV
jgi:hypothetical protein